jgi:hypothetical protein
MSKPANAELILAWDPERRAQMFELRATVQDRSVVSRVLTLAKLLDTDALAY